MFSGSDDIAVSHTSEDGDTTLIKAIFNRNNQLAFQLIAAGKNINVKDAEGRTAFVYAVKNNMTEIVKELLPTCDDVNVSDKYGDTAFLSAVRSNNKDMVKLLIDNGADPNVCDSDRDPPLKFAVINDNQEMAKLLIDNGADTNVCGSDRDPTLIRAVINDNQEMAKLLIDNGADINARNSDGDPALIFAVIIDNQEMAKLLIDNGADINACDSDGDPALIRAVCKNNQEMAKLLIDNGADINARDSDGDPAFIRAVFKNNQKMAKLLIDNGADTNVCDSYGHPALIRAVINDNQEMAKLLIDNGADTNVCDSYGHPAFIRAVINDNQEMAKLLIDNEAVINMLNKFGETALFSAARNNNEEMVKLLLENGIDVNAHDKSGQTALFFAAGSSNFIVSLLNDAGVKIDARDTNKETALFYAIRRGNMDVIKTLIDKNASLRVRNYKGRTPLFYAIHATRTLITFRLLISKGAILRDIDNLHFSVLRYYIERICGRTLKGDDFEILDEFAKDGQRDTIFNAVINVLYCKLPLFSNDRLSIKQEFLSNGISLSRKYVSTYQQEIVNKLCQLLDARPHPDKIPNMLDVLLNLGADCNTVDSDGNTALHNVVAVPVNGSSEVSIKSTISKLEQQGLLYDVRNFNDHTPILHALFVWDWDHDDAVWLNFEKTKVICESLLDYVSRVNERASNGESVFHLLLKLFARVMVLDDHSIRGEVLHHMLVLFKSFCPPYIKHGVTVNMPDETLRTPLHLWALFSLRPFDRYEDKLTGDLMFEGVLRDIFGHLKTCGIKLNVADATDRTPLHCCATWIAMKCLVEDEAKRHYLDSNGRHPLLAAAHNKIFQIKGGYFFPDLTIEPKAFFQMCVEMDLDLWACDHDGISILSLLLSSDSFILAKALVEVASSLKLVVLNQLLLTVCQDQATKNFWKSSLVEKMLRSTLPDKFNLCSALHSCCLNIKRLCDKGELELRKVKENDGYEPPIKRLKRDTSSRTDEGKSFSSPVSVHVDIALQLLPLHSASCECWTELSSSFPEFNILLEEVDHESVPIRIPWSSRSETHKDKLNQVARGQNIVSINSFWYHGCPIGSGAFGHVFAGINEKDGREIAIKKIEKLRMVRPEDKREIKSLITLAYCPWVVQYISFDETNKDFTYIVLELMEGHLDEYFESSLYDPRQSILLCRDLVMGLKYLHDQKPRGILHRDLKPSNILYKGHPKLCLKIADFGLSRSLTTADTTVLGTNAGTRCWIAPEVILSSNYQHTKESDNYSCGLLLHYILSQQKHPFSPADCSNRSTEIINHELQHNMINNTMEGWDVKISPEATDLIKGLLSWEPNERPSAADSLVHPMFWSNDKKMEFLCKFSEQSREKSVTQDIQSKFKIIVDYDTWVDDNYQQMSDIYTKLTEKREYDTRSVQDLIAFIRNARAHDRSLGNKLRSAILKKHVFLKNFPHLVIEVYKTVIAHRWNDKISIKQIMSREDL